MRQAIYANDLARYDQISTRITAGRNAAAQRILDANGTLHACPPLGGNSFFAQISANVVGGTFVDDLKRAFLAQAGDVRLGVGVGDDLLSAVEACERDVSASPSPDVLDKPLYLAFVWQGFLEQSFEDDFRLR